MSQNPAKRSTFQGKAMTFHESLHYCGCESCREDLKVRAVEEPPHRPEFVSYIEATYPNTADLMRKDSR